MSLISVYKRPNSPYWYFDVTVGDVRKRISTKRTLKREAIEVAEEYTQAHRDAHRRGSRLDEITLRDALMLHYLPKRRAELTAKRAPAHRAANVEHICKKVLGEVEGIRGLQKGIKMHEITSTMLVQYRTRRMAQGAAERTIDHEIRAISAAHHLVEADYLVKQGLKFPVGRPKGKPRFLLPNEEKALLAELNPGRPIQLKLRNGETGSYFLDASAQAFRQRQDNYDLVVMLLDTGCRFGEIAQLTWDMVDTIDWRFIHIHRWKVDNQGQLAITNRMREVLQRRRKARANSLFVFPGWKREGEGIDPEDLPRQGTIAIRRAMAKIGINHPAKVKRFGRRDVRSLRDTFATKLRHAGVSLDRIQTLLGHSTPQMTQKYADLTVDMASIEAARLLDTINKDTTNEPDHRPDQDA